MLAVEPRSRRQRDKELAPVRVRPRVGHAEDARTRVLKVTRDLVLKLATCRVEGAEMREPQFIQCKFFVANKGSPRALRAWCRSHADNAIKSLP